MSSLVEVKFLPKSSEVKIRTKTISNIMVILSGKNLSEENLPDLASAVISANQGHFANFSVLQNVKRPDIFRVGQSKVDCTIPDDFKMAKNFKMILKPGMKLQTLSQRLMFANPDGKKITNFQRSKILH